MYTSISIVRLLHRLSSVLQAEFLQPLNFRDQRRIVDLLWRAVVIHPILVRLMLSGRQLILQLLLQLQCVKNGSVGRIGLASDDCLQVGFRHTGGVVLAECHLQHVHKSRVVDITFDLRCHLHRNFLRSLCCHLAMLLELSELSCSTRRGRFCMLDGKDGGRWFSGIHRIIRRRVVY